MLSFLSRKLFSTSASVHQKTRPGLPLPPASYEDYYHLITADLALESLMRRLQQEQQAIRLLPHGAHESCATRVIASDPAQGWIEVLAPHLASVCQPVVERRLVHLSCDRWGETIMFSLDCIEASTEEQSHCYRLRFPSWALVVRFRRFVRVRLGPLKRQHDSLKAFFGVEQLPVINDISEGGLNLQLNQQQLDRLALHKTFTLGDFMQVDRQQPQVRMRLKHHSQGPQKTYQVGAEFMDLTPMQERELRLLVLQLQARTYGC
jgi:c-di-GMP-binding flagellar brake protein YcgR